ncbi:MAG: formate dehydrogenase accessory sulfurtransferase FdhD [Pseudomonadota bacterium]|nr:formate dehydrogenase accessory sulfurtransferase FdhD [Pseudomonadota bacterium]
MKTPTEHTELSGISSHRVDCWPEQPQQYDSIIEEAPVALIYNGVSHAVMMTTPTDLDAFARGFSFSEGIIDAAANIIDLDIVRDDPGIEIRMQLSQRYWHRLKQRKRSLLGATGCGICGTESLEMLRQNLSRGQVNASERSAAISDTSIQKAVAQLQQRQHLQKLTGGAHAAAWCDADGTIEYLFEDVGRHNAMDKLIGALLQKRAHGEGFILSTSRISYELVQKSIRYGAKTLVGLSAPTSMAIETAQKFNLQLVGFARKGRHNRYTLT